MKENSNFNNNTELANLSESIPHEINNTKKNEELNPLNKEEEIIESKRNNNYFCRKKGNTYIITVDINNNPIITVGPKTEWVFFVILILFISGGFLLLFIYYYHYIPQYLFLTGIFVYLIFIFVYTKMFITNPGFAEKIKVEKEKAKYLFCPICNIYVNKNSKTVHCTKCGLCVEEFNHHCGWIGKCIAKKNLYEFYFLIFWIFVIIMYFTATFTIAHYNWFEDEIDSRKK